METNLNWWQIIPRVTNYPWNWWQKNYPWNWYLKTVQKLPRQVSTNKPEEIRGQWANIISLPNFAEVLCPAIMAIKLAWQIRCEPRKPAKLNLKRWLMSISLFIIIPNPHRVASLHIIWGKKTFPLAFHGQNVIYLATVTPELSSIYITGCMEETKQDFLRNSMILSRWVSPHLPKM